MSEYLDIYNQLLSQAVSSKCSDIHIKENSPVNFRIAGKMVPVDFTPDHVFMEGVIQDISNEKQRKNYDETGDLDISYAMEGVGRFRLNIHRQRGLHAMTLRHVKSKIMTLEELSLPPILRKIAEFPRGIVLVCGTTGSGKSTTLAAMLDYINTNYQKHIITCEDPIEYEFLDKMSFFEQREVGMDVSSFYSSLTHALRQDPDIIMVGEMRDRESFEAALHAADTGHMVLSTVHAANATQVITRVLDMYPKTEQDAIRESLTLNLKATIAQRLIPKAFGGGVVPVNEIMINTPVVENLMKKNQLEKLPSAIAQGKEDGMQTFNFALLQRINNGDISETAGIEASDAPEELKMNLKGIFLGKNA